MTGMDVPRGVAVADWDALRATDRTSAREAGTQAIARDWRDRDRAPGGLCDIARQGAKDPRAALIAAADLVTAPGWLDRRVTSALMPTRDDPWSVPPCRTHHRAGQRGTVLFEAGALVVTLIVLSPTGVTAPATTVGFVHGLLLAHVVRSGGARVQRFRVTGCTDDPDRLTPGTAGHCTAGPIAPLCDGERLLLDQSCESYRLCDAPGDVVIVQCQWLVDPVLPMRDYDLTTGRLCRMASADRAGSFTTMALTLLRTMGRRDAVPEFVAALDSGDFSLRWNAMRELLALDPIAAAPHLARLAVADPHPDVRASASATQGLLLERNLIPAPQEATPCPV